MKLRKSYVCTYLYMLLLFAYYLCPRSFALFIPNYEAYVCICSNAPCSKFPKTPRKWFVIVMECDFWLGEMMLVHTSSNSTFDLFLSTSQVKYMYVIIRCCCFVTYSKCQTVVEIPVTFRQNKAKLHRLYTGQYVIIYICYDLKVGVHKH